MRRPAPPAATAATAVPPEAAELPPALQRQLARRYRPLPGRRRWLIGLLAIATAITIFWLLIYRPGGLHGPRWHPGRALCAPGQSTECVGGQSDVILLPPAGPASAGG
ncbi:MAG: hypothetical protein KGI90_06310 [Burkholderiales bacterium]|nr:hypothetical protein [Burkholderiales bacterium]